MSEIKGDYTLTINGSEGEKKCELREIPKNLFFKVFGMIAPMYGDEEPRLLEAGEIILRECFLAGDKEILLSDEYLTAGAIQCVGLIKVADATIKKN